MWRSAKLCCALLIFVLVLSFAGVVLAASYCPNCEAAMRDNPVCPICHFCCECGGISTTTDVCSVCGANAESMAKSSAEAEENGEEAPEATPAPTLSPEEQAELVENTELFTVRDGVVWPNAYPYPELLRVKKIETQYHSADYFEDAETGVGYNMLRITMEVEFGNYELALAYMEQLRATGEFKREDVLFEHQTEPYVPIRLQEAGGDLYDIDTDNTAEIAYGIRNTRFSTAAPDDVGEAVARSSWLQVSPREFLTEEYQNNYWTYYAPQYEPQDGLYVKNLKNGKTELYYTGLAGYSVIQLHYVYPASVPLPSAVPTEAPTAAPTAKPSSQGTNRVIQLDDGSYVTVDEDGNIVTGGSGGKVEQRADGTYVSVTEDLPAPETEDGTTAGVVALVLVGLVAVPLTAARGSDTPGGKDGADAKPAEPLVEGTPFTQSQLDHFAEGELNYKLGEAQEQTFRDLSKADFSNLGWERSADGTWIDATEGGFFRYDKNGNLIERVTSDTLRGESIRSMLNVDKNGNIVSSKDTIYDSTTNQSVGTSETKYRADGTKEVTRYNTDGTIESHGLYDKNGRVLTDERGNPLSAESYNSNGTLKRKNYTAQMTEQGSTGVGGYTEKTTHYVVEEIYDKNGNLLQKRYKNAETFEVTTYDGKGNVLHGRDIMPK